MIQQFIKKQRKMLTGAMNTYWRKAGRFYDESWWDKAFYTEGISDKNTIWARQSLISTKFHYASIEMKIAEHLANYKVRIDGSNVMDIGSGAGHWIDFYADLGAKSVLGFDISDNSYEFLKKKYAGNSGITIQHGKASAVISSLNGKEKFDIVNAIGVMFHIVDDEDWVDTINKISSVMKPGGLYIVGGHFGLLPNLNVQIDKQGNINKRLRSKSQWVSALKKAGFGDIKIYRNNAYLRIKEVLPESNVLVARKK